MSEEILDLGCGGLKIFQDPEGYCFTTDSVLLANFVKCKKTDQVVEFCAGSGVISILLSNKQKPQRIYAFEIQKRLYEMFERSIKLNCLEGTIIPFNLPLEDSSKVLSNQRIDVVFCNPPYMESGDKSLKEEIALATHEIGTSLDQIVSSAERILKYGGKFYMVHKADRLVDVLVTLRKYSLEPKILKIVYPSNNAEPSIFLVSATKKAKKGIRISPQIV